MLFAVVSLSWCHTDHNRPILRLPFFVFVSFVVLQLSFLSLDVVVYGRLWHDHRFSRCLCPLLYVLLRPWSLAATLCHQKIVQLWNFFCCVHSLHWYLVIMLLLLLLLFALSHAAPFGHLVRQVHCSTYDMVIAWFIPYHFNCFNDSIDRFNQSNGTKFNNNPFDLSIMISVSFQCIFLLASLFIEFVFLKIFLYWICKRANERARGREKRAFIPI